MDRPKAPDVLKQVQQTQQTQQTQQPPSPPISRSISTSNSPPPTDRQSLSKCAPSTAQTPPQSPLLGSSISNIEIVVAHYNEDLDWLYPFASSCHVYTKGNSLPSKAASSSPDYKSIHRLSNTGRETHSYLTYITAHYHNLPPYLLLVQGDIHTINNGTPAHTDLPLSDIIHLTRQLAPGDVLPIGLVKRFSDWNGMVYKEGWLERRGSTLVRSKLSPGEFWKLFFGNEDSREEDMPNGQLPDSVRFVQGACFGVTREAILRRPKRFYERILKCFDSLNEMNPEEGHYMERLWYSILSDDAVEGEGSIDVEE